MLPLMLMLVADPVTPPPAEPPTAPTVRIDADGVMRGVVRSQDAAQGDCRNGRLQQAGDAPSAQRVAPVVNDLMFRQGDPVQMTLLLERRIGQCSVPISYDVTTPGGRLPSFPARAD